jgi:Domain of unknown function (DUF4907)
LVEAAGYAFDTVEYVFDAVGAKGAPDPEISAKSPDTGAKKLLWQVFQGDWRASQVRWKEAAGTFARTYSRQAHCCAGRRIAVFQMLAFWTFLTRALRRVAPLLSVWLLSVWLLPLAPLMGQQRPLGLDVYTYQIIAAEGDTYGYEIWKNNHPFIRQVTIPGQAGTRGFRSVAHASAVARLVIRKLQRYAGMPAVTRAELDSLHVRP